MRVTIHHLISLCFLTAIVTSPQLSEAQTGDNTTRPETFTGTVIGIGGPLAGRSTGFTLTVDKVTSEQDIGRYLGALIEGGQDAVMNRIKDQKVGRFSITGQVGRDVNVVRVRRTETGRRITLLFERWLNLFEARYGTRSQDYPFTYVEIHVDAQGKGEGTLIPAARVRFDKEEQSVEIENFGIYPARLAGVRVQ